MARFIFSNQFPAGTEWYAFIGFDEIDGEVTEATLPHNLGKRMSVSLRHVSK